MSKQQQQLTDWFPGNVKPARAGVYQRERPHTDCLHYSRFEKGVWYAYWDSAEQAAIEKGRSAYQNLSWRGLAQEPQS